MSERTGSRRWREVLGVSPLEAKLLGLVLLCLLPAFLYILHLGIAEKSQERDTVRARTELLARLASAHYARTLDASRELLHAVTHILHSVPAGDPACGATLADLLADHPDYLNLGVIDPNGNILASAVPQVGPVYLGDRAYFRRAMATRRFAVGDYQVGRITRRPSVNVAYPMIGDDGSVTQVVFAAIDLVWLPSFLGDADLPPHTTVTLIDDKGIVLARIPDPTPWVGREFSEPALLHAVRDRVRGTVECVDTDGIEQLYGYAPLPLGSDAGSIVVGVPETAAFAPVDRAYGEALFSLGVVLLLALLAAKLVGRMVIVAPVRNLVAAADRVASLAPPPGLAGGTDRGELDRLARAIRGMAETLEDRRRGSDAAREELRLIDSRFRAFMENSPAVCFIKDSDGAYVHVNRRFREVFGRDVTGLTDHQWLPHAVAARLRANDLQVVDGREPVEATESIPDPDGGSRRWLAIKFPLEGPRGEIMIGGIKIDLSSRDDLERRFQHAQKLEAVGRLAGGVAHDFNNLLTALLGQVQFLEDDLSPGHPGREHLDQIEKAGRRAAELTRQLLAFSRRQKVDPRILDLNAVLADLTPMLSRLIGEDVELAVEPAPAPAPVEVDPGQIEQVIMNLAVNARDAMPRGGTLTLRVTAADRPDPEGDDARSEPGVALEIIDTGEGMDEETRARIFEPFFTTKEPGKGTGLGLATVYGLVTMMNGDIKVESRVGEGTAFTVLLPRAQAAPEITPMPLRPGPLPAGSETVLVIEDDDQVRTVTRQTLEDCGYRVLEAADGLAGLRVASTHPGIIDLVVADIVMPRLPGPEAVQRIRRDRPECKALFVSGYDSRVLSLEEYAHFGTCLAKPFSPEELARAVRRLLDGDRAAAA